MSCKELIDSLRKTADERILEIRQESERDAAAARDEVARRLAQQRGDAERKRDAGRREALAHALSAANNRARSVRLSAEQAISGQLRDAARSSLASLRTAGYEAVFERLARELPSNSWETVRVNPADVALARTLFSGAEIVPDPAITGGLDAADGSIRIVNTFEKRLERAWGDMLPVLIEEVYREVSDGTPAGS